MMSLPKIKKYIFCLLLSFTYSLSFTHTSFGIDWKEAGGEHFMVYFTKDEKFAKRALNKAEVYYRRIATELGYPRYSDFWLWDDRVKIYIYPDKPSFLKATEQPEWSEGMADYVEKSIASYAWSKNFLDSILPHETAHLIFRDFVGFEGEVPLWLDEGVAQWAEEIKRENMKKMVRELYKEDKLLLVEDLTKMDVRRFKEKNRVYIKATRLREGGQGVLFLSIDQLVSTFYLQAVSLIGFLIERYGSDRFAHFCRQLRDGKSLEEALRFAYPNHVRTLADLEDNWREYLEKDLLEEKK